jgi:hypothetical protein
MPRQKQQKPASATTIAARVRAVLAFLPVPLDDLQASCVLHPDDSSTFDAALAEMLTTGAVIQEPEPDEWLALPAPSPSNPTGA